MTLCATIWKGQRQADSVALRRLAAMDQENADHLCLLQVGLQKSAIAGVSMNATASRVFCTPRRDFVVIRHISADGVHFPTMPAEFLGEVKKTS